MLAISLKENDHVTIGDDIKVYIVESKSYDGEKMVRLGVDAPRDLEIRRHHKRRGRKRD